MSSTTYSPLDSPLLAASVAALGPAVVGVVLGMRFGVDAVLARAIGLPAAVVGLTFVLAPALYIGVAAVGAPTSAEDVARGTFRAVAALGTLLLALSPALAFLVGSATSSRAAAPLGFVVVAMAVLLALVGLRRSLLPAHAPLRAQALFALWSLLALGIGARVVGDLLFVF